MAKNVQLTIDIKGNDSVAQASEKTKALKENIQKLKETLASGGLGEKEYEKATEKLQKYEDRLNKFTNKTTSLQSELRELTNEIASGKLSGKDLILATERAGALKDQIADAKQEVNNLSSDTRKLDAFLELGSGIAGGFAAAQGAMALFGSENEDLQKSLVKVQSAVALLNGVQAVANSLNKSSALITEAQSIKLKVLTFIQTRYTAAVGASTGAMKLLRIAGATLGIGLIVTAIGLLIANFDKIKKAVLNFVPALANLGDLFTKVKNAVMDFVGISSEAERQEEKAAKQRAVRSQQMQYEIELMEANGASARDLYLAKRKLLFNDLETLKIAAFKKDATQEEIKGYNDMVQAIRVLDAEETTRLKEGANKEKEAANKRAEERKKDAAKRKEEADRQEAERIAQAKKEQEEIRKVVADEEEAKRLRGKTQFELELMELQKKAEQKLEIVKGDLEAQKLIRENYEKDVASLSDKYKKEEAQKEEESKEKAKADYKKFTDDIKDANNQVQDAKIQAIAQAGQILSQFAGQNKALATAALAVEKGAAIADVVIKGIRERALISATYGATPPIAAPLLAASKIRTGIAVASIAAATIQGARSISASGGSGGGSVQPPNIRGSQTTNEQPTPQPTKVFVTETDIRSVTRKVDGIFTQATII